MQLTIKNENDILLDWDLLVESMKTENPIWIKKAQELLLKFFYEKEANIWYTTTFLKQKEYEILKEIRNVEYIWINTTKKQCTENIQRRKRKEEIRNIKRLENINGEIYKEYFINKYNIAFKIIEVFENGERW